MVVRFLGGLLLVASMVEGSATFHEALERAHTPALKHFADRLMPLDAENDLRAGNGNEDTTEDALRAALAKDPYDTRSWIDLSARAEMRGDSAGAENALLQAAAHNIGRQPRWALLNFYFRKGDAKDFLSWVNSYRSVTHDHEDGLFRMVAEQIPAQQDWFQALPHLGCDELKTAVDLFAQRQADHHELLDAMAAGCRDSASTEALSRTVGDLLLNDQVEQAAQTWRRMGHTATLTNTDFHQPVSGQGFDWRINRSPGLQWQQHDQQLVFDLQDGIAEGTVLLFQPVLLDAGARYRLVMNAESDAAPTQAFRWELVELSTGRHIPSELDQENENGIASWEFSAPVNTHRALALALIYMRPEGETTFHGELTLRGVQLSRRLVQ